MGYTLFSEEWIEQVEKEMRAGPSEERLETVEDNYWEWIETNKQDITIRLGLVLNGENEGESRYAYFEIKEGEVESSFLGSAEERGTADVILGAGYDGWIETIEGPREVPQNIMYRDIKLEQGNIHFFFRKIYFFVELLRNLVRVPIKSEAHQGA